MSGDFEISLGQLSRENREAVKLIRSQLEEVENSAIKDVKRLVCAAIDEVLMCKHPDAKSCDSLAYEIDDVLWQEGEQKRYRPQRGLSEEAISSLKAISSALKKASNTDAKASPLEDLYKNA